MRLPPLPYLPVEKLLNSGGVPVNMVFSGGVA